LTFNDHLDITTSEGVTVRLTIAGIGSRSLAFLLDVIVVGTALVTIGAIGIQTSDVEDLLALGILTAVVLFIPLAYLVTMETLNGGKTLGKMAAGIKVVKVSGAPIGFGAAVVRALLLPIDTLLFGVGIVAMFVNDKSQRLGDMAARTVVVRDRMKQTYDVRMTPGSMPVDPNTRRWDVTAISDQEIAVVRSFLARASGLDAGARTAYAAQLRERIGPRVGGAETGLPDEVFLARVVAEKHRD
jgi:uncharacterized RDD family membrane protein YckC